MDLVSPVQCQALNPWHVYLNPKNQIRLYVSPFCLQGALSPCRCVLCVICLVLRRMTSPGLIVVAWTHTYQRASGSQPQRWLLRYFFPPRCVCECHARQDALRKNCGDRWSGVTLVSWHGFKSSFLWPHARTHLIHLHMGDPLPRMVFPAFFFILLGRIFLIWLCC